MIEPEAFVEQLCRKLDLKTDYQQFCDIWSRIFLPETLIPESLLKGLRKRFRLLLLSNTNVIHFRMIREKYPIIRQFHDLVLSYEVGAMKPAPRIYQEAIDRAHCRAEECFFTDDIETYVDAAKQAGMDAVQFQSREQIEQELAARGVTWD